MDSFDIDSLLRFSPPTRLCRKCYALNSGMPVNSARDRLTCQVCGVEYLASDTFSVWDAENYFQVCGLALKFKDAVAHGRTLATIARDMRRYTERGKSAGPRPLMRCLYEALHAAEHFVHFVTYGMSRELLGAIRMAAVHVPVRGIVSNADNWLVDELTKYQLESPKLEAQIFRRSDKPADWAASPHQKVIVVDGLMAFKGSANLTVDGWRKAAEDLDSIEVVTDVKEVVDLHNRLFSRLWGSFSNEQQIIMEDFIPF